MPRVPGTVYNDDAYAERASRMQFGKMMLFCGNSGEELAEEIAAELAKKSGYDNFRLGLSETVMFSNENIFVKLKYSRWPVNVLAHKLICSLYCWIVSPKNI